MARNLLLVFMGVLIGALGFHLVNKVRTDDPAIQASEIDRPQSIEEPRAQSGQKTKVEEAFAEVRGLGAATPPHSREQVDLVRLPMKYAEQIGVARSRRPSFSERHAQFAAEQRNESWAFAMEAGIQNFLAAHAADSGIVIESVECRSKSCEVAGYVSDESDGINSTIYGFTSEHWWDGGNSVSVKEFDLEGSTGFIFVTFEHHDTDLDR